MRNGRRKRSSGARAQGRRPLRPWRRRSTRRTAWIAGIYAAAASGWILLSDRMLGAMVADKQWLLRLSMAKGIVFVAATTALLAWLVWRSFAAIERSYDALVTKSRALRASEEKLAAVLRSAKDGIVTVDANERIVMLNDAAAVMLGCAAHRAIGKRLDRFLAKALPDQDESTLRLAIRREEDEAPMSVEASTARIDVANQQLRTVILRDIAERRAFELEIERLNRLYAALTHINQAIVRSSSRDELLTRTCEALVVHGGFALAWIAWHLPDEERLVLITSSGEDGELASAAAEMPAGEGEHPGVPSWMALRSGAPWISNAMDADPGAAFWWEEAERYAWRSCGAFPIRVDNRVAGVLNVFAAAPGVFKQRETELLEEAAVDLSFALDHLEEEARRRHAEALVRSERSFSDAMIESMPGILYFYDENGRFLRWNENFGRVSGYTAEEIAGMTPLDFFDAEERELVEQRIGVVFEQGESSVEARFRAKDGTKTPYFFTGRRIVHDGKPSLVGVGIDISQRVRAETELRGLATSLEKKVGERTVELQAALVQARAADHLKSAFLATMSHELRTPLNSIIGFTGILAQGLAGPLNEEQTRQLGMVRTSARHLLALINDVLDLSKIEAGQLPVAQAPLDLRAAIEQSVATVRPMADEKQLSVHVHVDSGVGEIRGDRRRVEQILLNLLNNAVKFTDGGSVNLTAERSEEAVAGVAGPAVRITVRDTGIGIDADGLAVLFQPFRQLDTGLTRQHEGTGLGLAICRRLADLMGGTISAASQRGVGSEFTVVLPVNGRATEPPQTADGLASSSA